MKILSRVCVEFKNKKGEVVYRITPAKRLVYLDDAPDSIKEDLIFDALVADGSLEVIDTPAKKKAAEQDPTAGMTAEGKKEPEKKTDNKTGAKADAKAAK